MRLEDQVALVTGGSKGIGAAIAIALGEAGAKVAVNYATDMAGATRTAQTIEERGGEAKAFQADVSGRAEVARLFDEVREAFGAVDVLVNNAAIFSFQRLEEITESEFRRQYEVNVLGVILMMQRFVEQAPAKGASVINISTAGIAANTPGSALYTSTKGASTTLTRVFAKELAPRGIRVNAIAPGATDTEGARAQDLLAGEMVEKLVAGTPLGRLGRPDDIGPVAVFLASDDARWVTGDVIFASGGSR